MTYKSIIRCLLLSAATTGLLTACSDWNEPEAREPEVITPAEQDPAAYAAYTASLRAWKATPHQVTVAVLDNAPEISVSERDFLRSLPDSIDFVAMRNANRLSQHDRDDIAMVRRDFATKVLYYLDCASATPEQWQAAASAIASGQFDGAVVASATAPDATLLALLPDGSALFFEGSPSVLPESDRSRFSHFIIDITSAKDAYDIEMAVRLASLAADRSKLLLGTAPGGQLTDINGVTRNAVAGAAVAAKSSAPALGGIAIGNISADYYDADIIYKRTRGAIQILNPAK